MGKRRTDSEHVETLRRRMDHLEKRIRGGLIDGVDLTYDRAELGALAWAVSIVEPLSKRREDAGSPVGDVEGTKRGTRG